MKYDFDIFCNVSNIDYTKSQQYKDDVLSIVNSAEAYNFNGVLSHFNNLTVDPFILASTILNNTNNICPIIACLPSYSDPVSTAKKVKSLISLYGKKVNLNMITGASKTELDQISEHLDHNERYERLEEYIDIIREILSSDGPVSYSGKYYKYNKLFLGGAIPKHLFPKIYVAGSSDNAINIAHSHTDVLITHPGPIQHFKDNFLSKLHNPSLKIGIEIGIITRKTNSEAWEVAKTLYPPNFLGNLHTKVKLNSQSNWIRQMAELGTNSEIYDNVFWMGAFTSGLANIPILVGSYDEVADYFANYLAAGVKVIILTELRTPDEFEHVNVVLKKI